MDSGQKTFDDTIRDQMELGYVATRPRFSRRRRTWTANVRNLREEDIRALDVFASLTVQGGAQSFYYPNLIPNGSFEFPASLPGDAFLDWTIQKAQNCTIESSANAADGISALQVLTSAFALSGGNPLTAQIAARKAFTVVPGEVYEGVFQQLATLASLGSATATLNMQIVLLMSDGSQVIVQPSASNVLASSTAYMTIAQTFTIPQPSAGLAIIGAFASFVLSLTSAVELTMSPTYPPAAGDGYLSVLVDGAGLALITAAPGYSIYGRMVGSASLPFPVRFAPSKIPAFSDIGMGDGVKRYGATFDLEEV